MPNYVIKSDKRIEPYKESKIKNTLLRLKINEEEINEILELIKKNFPQEKVRTRDIFKFIFDYLKIKERKEAYSFNLKNAILKLGPSGYPFEKFMAHLYKLYGFEAHHNLFLDGKCLKYEIDLLLKKDNFFYIAECKFHQQPWKKSDVKMILYVYGRYLDIKEKFKENSICLVITNTKFTQEAIKFSNCYFIELLSWNFPEERSLAKLIDEKKAYPLTIFDFLSNKVLQDLFKYDIVLISDFLSKENSYLRKISNLKIEEIEEIKRKIRLILGIDK